MALKTPARKRVEPARRSAQDPGAIFDAALARGLTLPKGLSLETARAVYVEHPPAEWSEQDVREWCAGRLRDWKRKQDDPAWREMRSKIGRKLNDARAFVKLDRMQLHSDRALVHEKIIEALAGALENLKHHARQREALQLRRRIADGDLIDARSRMGIYPDLFKAREADALKRLSEIGAEDEALDRYVPLTPKGIMDDLSLHLFAIARKVVPRRSAAEPDGVSGRHLHHEVLTPILQAFTEVDAVVPKRIKGRGRTVEVAPRQRLKRALTVREQESAKAADVWRDGRDALSRADLVLQAQDLLFSWDLRFTRSLSRTR